MLALSTPSHPQLFCAFIPPALQACYCKASLRAQLERLRRQELGEEDEGEEAEQEDEAANGIAGVQQGTRQQRRRLRRGEEEHLPGQDSKDEDEAQPVAAAAGKVAKRQHPAGGPAAPPAKRRRQQAQQEAGDQPLGVASTLPRKRKANGEACARCRWTEGCMRAYVCAHGAAWASYHAV